MRPPRFARWVLSLAAPPERRGDVLADLDEEFRSGEHPDAPAWYRRQVRQSVGPLMAQRLRALSESPRGLAQDFRVACRSLAAVPVFTGGIIAMLGVGIGALLVVYAVVDGLLLRPMPFGDRSERLVTIHSLHPTVAPDWDDAEVSYPDLVAMRQAASLEAIEGVIGRNVSLSSGAETVRVPAASVTIGLLEMLNAKPSLGRSFTANDAAPPGLETSVIIGDGLWKSLFGADPNVVGRTVLVNGRALAVVGVMGEGFAFPDGPQLWLPYRGDETARANRGVLAVGLLRSGVSISQARSELNGVASALAKEFPSTNRGWTAHVMPIRDFLVAGRDERTILGAVIFVLIAVCANVAGLIVARGVGRRRELTLRSALGAGRARLVRLLAVETVVLAGAGGMLGLAGAAWGVRALLAWSPDAPPYWARPEIDWRVSTMAIVVTLLVAMAAGLLPAIRLTRVDASGASGALLPGARVNGGRPQHRRLQHGLVAAQVALSFALLIGAGLLSRSATALLNADGGFSPSELASARVYIAGDRYDDTSVRGAAVNAVLKSLMSIPGVEAAASTGSIPTDDGGAAARIKDPAAPGDAERLIGVQLTPASGTLWSTLKTGMRAGRAFTDAEAADSRLDIAIVNASLAARLWPGESPLERTIEVSEPQPDSGRPSGSFARMRIVGVAPDLVYEEFGESTPQSQLMVYVPTARAAWRTHALLIRTSMPTAALAPAIRAAIRTVDPGFAAYDVMTMSERRAYNHWGERFIGRAASAFAIVALLLASIGAYAIASYTVAQRTREIGVRMALGSSRERVLAGFLWLGARLAVAGSAVGLLLGFGVAKLLQDRLFQTSAWDVSGWGLAAAVLLTTVIVATFTPARRASRIQPSEALRND